MTGHDLHNYLDARCGFPVSGRLREKARQHFRRAEQVLALYATSSKTIDVPRLARTIIDDRTCEAMGLALLTRKVLVLPTMIKLREMQRITSGGLGDDLQSIERDLMDWNRRWGPGMTVKDMEDAEIWFSFQAELLRYCDMSHYPPELVADYTSEDSRWGVTHAPLRGDSLICDYIRKWEIGWRRFLPWNR